MVCVGRLKKFDKKYLDHNLKYTSWSMYICLKCKTEIIKNRENNHFLLIGGELMALIYSCDEMIIKNIIE